MDIAPKELAPVIQLGGGVPWTSRQGPELALLCWHCGEVWHALIRGAWHTRDGQDGAWWDLECGEPIDLVILGSVAMQGAMKWQRWW